MDRGEIAAGFDAQGDATKVLSTLTTMLMHASVGLDLSQYFTVQQHHTHLACMPPTWSDMRNTYCAVSQMLCTHGLSSEHRGIKVLAYELVRIIGSLTPPTPHAHSQRGGEMRGLTLALRKF